MDWMVDGGYGYCRIYVCRYVGMEKGPAPRLIVQKYYTLSGSFSHTTGPGASVETKRIKSFILFDRRKKCHAI